MLAKSVSVFFVVLCAAYVFTADGLSFGAFSYPKAGFVPMIVGLGALSLAAINMVVTFAGERSFTLPRTNVRQVGLLVLGLIAVLILLQIVGFLVATFVGLLYLLKVSGTGGWVVPLGISVAVSGGLYVVFDVLLHVPLP